MREVVLNAIYSREDLAELFEVDPRTVSVYYTKGLPKKKSVRGNCTTGRQVMEWLENGAEERKTEQNPKVVKFKQHHMG